MLAVPVLCFSIPSSCIRLPLLNILAYLYFLLSRLFMFTRVRCSPLLVVVVDLTLVRVIIYAFYSSCLLSLPLCCLRCFSTHAHYDHAFILTLFCCNHSPSDCSACARQGYRVIPASVYSCHCVMIHSRVYSFVR
ncbi:hypothetical protein BDF22DRAFT_354745 [Syncephalis plumigaleata]|nr:hypothetical protein BDF22DRAFT_354745 [Syncephalis plumigaleata]